MFDNRYVAVLADTDESIKIHDELSCDLNLRDKENERTEKRGNKLIDKVIHFIVLDNLEWRWLATLSIFMIGTRQLPLEQRVELDYLVKEDVPGDVAKISGLSLISNCEHQNRANRSVPRAKRKAETTRIYLGLIRAAKEYCSTKGLKHGLLFTGKSLTLAFRQSGLNIQDVGACEEAYSNDADYPCYMNFDNIVECTDKASNSVFEMFKKRGTYCTYSKLTRVYSDLPTFV